MDFELKINKENLPSNELLELHEEAKGYLANSKSENTKSAYQSDWKQFSNWCEENRLQDLPADILTITSYIAKLARTYRASSIKRKLAAISKAHEYAGYLSPTKHPKVKEVWDGTKRTIGIKEIGKGSLASRFTNNG